MPLKQLEKPGLIYIVYWRKEFKDFEEFKNLLEPLLKNDQERRSIIIDLTKNATITDGEVGLLAKVIKGLHGSQRYLMIVAADPIIRKFDATNLIKAGNVKVYYNHLSLFESLSRNRDVTGAEKKYGEAKEEGKRTKDRESKAP